MNNYAKTHTHTHTQRPLHKLQEATSSTRAETFNCLLVGFDCGGGDWF